MERGDAARHAGRLGAILALIAIAGWCMWLAALAVGAPLRHHAGPEVDSIGGQGALAWVPFVLALVGTAVFHEYAHAVVAYWRGDRTARRRGRLTLDPRPHVSPLGTIVLPLGLRALGSPVLIGWAKPVPLDWSLLVAPRRSMALVAAAGPAINVALGLAVGWVVIALGAALSLASAAGGASISAAGWTDPRAAIQLAAAGDAPSWIRLACALAGPLLTFLKFGVMVNLLLATFNLIPIPPLDGSKILSPFLPTSWLRLTLGRGAMIGGLVLLVLLATTGLLFVIAIPAVMPVWVIFCCVGWLSGLMPL